MNTLTLSGAVGVNWLGIGLIAVFSFVLGFALNRGSICTVVATTDLVKKGHPGRSIALLETTLWAGSVYAVLQISPFIPDGWLPLGYLIPGTLLFAIGSYVNGACVFGSIGNFGSGHIEFAFVFIGIFFVTFLHTYFDPLTRLLPAHPPQRAKLPLGGAVFLLALPLLVWLRLALTGRKEQNFRLLTLTMGAAGIAFTFLAVLTPLFSITASVKTVISVPVAGTVSVAGTFLGSMISGLMNTHPVKLKWPTWRGVVKRFGGGMLMGLGAVLIPGGNDTLLLVGLPGFAWQAAVSYAILVAVLAAMIAVLGARKIRG